MIIPDHNLLIGVPVELSLLIGKKKHFFETGLGYTYYYDFGNDFFIVPRIGYRFQKPQGGFFFKCGYTPFYHFSDVPDHYVYSNYHRFNHWAGIGLGYTFK